MKVFAKLRDSRIRLLMHVPDTHQQMLEYLLKQLEKKDPQQVFAWPVTDAIAPGYSSIISQPMDFSTMKQKIEDNNYTTLKQFEVE